MKLTVEAFMNYSKIIDGLYEYKKQSTELIKAIPMSVERQSNMIKDIEDSVDNQVKDILKGIKGKYGIDMVVI